MPGPVQAERIRALKAKGVSNAEIVQTLGCTLNAIYSALRHAEDNRGMKRRVKRCPCCDQRLPPHLRDEPISLLLENASAPTPISQS